MNWYYLAPASAVGFLILTDPSVLLTLIGFAGVYALLLWLADALLGDKSNRK